MQVRSARVLVERLEQLLAHLPDSDFAARQRRLEASACLSIARTLHAVAIELSKAEQRR